MQPSRLIWTIGVTTALALWNAAFALAADAKPAEGTAIDISAGIPAEPESGGVARIRKALDEPAEAAFVEVPLAEVVEVLAKRHGINLMLDNKSLEDAGTGIDTPITKNLKNVSLKSLLRLMLGPMDLGYVIKDEVLLITTKEKYDSELRIRVYPVRDLLERRNQVNFLPDPAADLIDMLTTTIALTTWDKVGGPGSIQYLAAAESLVISQTEYVHEEIHKTLVAARKAQGLAPSGDHAAGVDNPNEMVVAIYWLGVSTRNYEIAAEPAAPGSEAVNPASSDKGRQLPRAVLVSTRAVADDVARAIPKIIAPESWQGGGGQGTIESIGHGVAVRQTLGVHQQVARFLKSIQRAQEKAKAGRSVGMAGGGGFFSVRPPADSSQ